MLQAIVFDFDGVLVDSEPLHFQALMMVAKGIGLSFDYEQYLRDFVGFDDRDAFRVMLDALPGPAQGDRAGTIAQLCAQKRATFETLVKAGGAAALPGALDLAEEARRAGMATAIASGAVRTDIEILLDCLQRRDHFDPIVSADDVMRSKPDPQTYGLAVQRLGLEPGECLAIEDTAAGISSACTAGLMTLGVATIGPPQRLHDAQRVVDSLQDVDLAKLRGWYG